MKDKFEEDRTENEIKNDFYIKKCVSCGFEYEFYYNGNNVLECPYCGTSLKHETVKDVVEANTSLLEAFECRPYKKLFCPRCESTNIATINPKYCHYREVRKYLRCLECNAFIREDPDYDIIFSYELYGWVKYEEMPPTALDEAAAEVREVENYIHKQIKIAESRLQWYEHAKQLGIKAKSALERYGFGYMIVFFILTLVSYLLTPYSSCKYAFLLLFIPELIIISYFGGVYKPFYKFWTNPEWNENCKRKRASKPIDEKVYFRYSILFNLIFSLVTFVGINVLIWGLYSVDCGLFFSIPIFGFIVILFATCYGGFASGDDFDVGIHYEKENLNNCISELNRVS